MHLKFLISGLLGCLLLCSACKQEIIPKNYAGTTKSDFQKSNRLAAEWEPALGAIIAWPLDIPHKLVIELARDGRLYTMVPDKTEKQEAIKWYKKWAIDLNKVEFIIAPQGFDSWWTRDWGPFAVFTSEGEMKLADGQYEYSTPVSGLDCDEKLEHVFTEKDEQGNEKILLTTLDDKAPDSIGSHMNLDMIELPFPFTGGNVFSDGQGMALSTCIIKNENKFIGGSDESMINQANELLGIHTYNFISNFEYDGIQHIDCFLKMLDQDRLFVARTPKNHPLHDIYEKIVKNELSQLKNSSGNPFTILRLDTDVYRKDELAAYTNSLILNKTIYVPLFGIDQDKIAIEQWQDAMPGYTVKGFEYWVNEEPILHPRAKKRRHSGLGWNGGDALHCRTRAMWDPHMLYISANRIPEMISETKAHHFETRIIDYSKKGLVDGESVVHWRESGSEDWQTSQLDMNGDNYYSTKLPQLENNSIIEYYFSAKSKSGKIETMPRTAPAGLYHFSFERSK